MSKLLDDKQQRQFELIKILTQTDRRLSYSYLADKLDVSTRSISNDLDFLEQEFEDIIHFDRNRNGSIAYMNRKYGISTIQRYFMSNSLAHQLIYWVFFHPDKSIEDCAMDLNYSTSSIRRTVQKINEEVSKFYDVHLKTSPLTFSGDEEEIQHFYIQFFIETNEASFWPFSDLSDEATLTNCVKNLARALGIEVTFSRLRYLKIAICVAWARLKQGSYIDFGHEEDVILPIADDILSQQQFSQCLRQSALLMNLKIDQQLLLQTFHILLSQPNDYSIHTYTEDSNIQPLIERLFVKFNDLQEQFDLEIEDPSAFVDLMVADIRLYRSNFGANTLFFDHTSDFLKRMHNIHPPLYQKIHSNLNDCICEFFPENPSIQSYLMYCIYKNWPNLIPQLLKKENQVHGIVISYFGNEIAQMKCDILNTYLESFIEFYCFQGPDLSRESLSYLSAYDLIITDFKLFAHDDQLVINIDSLPSAEDAVYIFDKCKDWA